ncbi:thiamine diphosphate-binding protein [Meredithblackwellia eburnea MCA 4105]
MVFTTSNVFLQVLVEAGITHAFVNLGSDHPALLEAFAQRKQDGLKGLEIVTCPNEMVALSCAQGYAQATGKPAAVIVHVDCGTQALAGAVHNVSTCRTPVFIYAGASPFTQDNELAGSRNEFIHYLQNAVDQPQILRQYMRHTAEIRTGKNVQQVVLRALQYAKSEPQGPVYCWAMREITEEHLDPQGVPDVRVNEVWSEIEKSPLNKKTVETIATALATAKKPLIVTSYVGRNPGAVTQLIKLVETLAIPVFSSCPSYVNIAFDHISHSGVSFGQNNPLVEEADVILILDSDVPWVPMHTHPSKSAKIYHIDCDPLKERMAFHAFPSLIRAKADAELALEQMNDFLASTTSLVTPSIISSRLASLKSQKQSLESALNKLEQVPADNILTAPYIVAALRKASPSKTTILNEAISNYPHVWNHTIPSGPGKLFTSGASSLGWALGAAIGVSLAGKVDKEQERDLLAVVVGDGSFVFGVPSASYWIARRYETPFLTIVLNNGGWKSPKLSLLGVHPNGLASKTSAQDLNVSFGPDAPDYGGIAAAAGGAWAKKVLKVDELDGALKEAIRVVREEKRCALLDCWLERF